MRSIRRKRGKYLFIEGTNNEENGKLAQGFHKLLFQKLEGKMPRIKMANSKSEAIRTFKRSTLSNDKYLLIDLDAPASQKNESIKDNGLSEDNHRCFFMIQEMEAWFLSQPHILDAHFRKKISVKIKQPAQDIANPDKFLRKITKGSPKGTYHKVEDGTALMQKLNAQKLMDEFEDFAALIKALLKQ